MTTPRKIEVDKLDVDQIELLLENARTPEDLREPLLERLRSLGMEEPERTDGLDTAKPASSRIGSGRDD
jgi:hypothetical protein